MISTLRKMLPMGLALGAILACGSGTHAEFITYLAGGTFAGGGTPGTPTYTDIADPSTTVAYTTTLSTASAPPATQVSFGTFTTASGASPSTPTAVASSFALTIVNTATSDSITFMATLGGTLSSSSSLAFVQFAGPLTQTLDGIEFKINSFDSGIAGRVNLGAPTSNGGSTTLNGLINVVPEPSALALLGLGGSTLCGLAYRRRMKVAA